MWGLMKRRHVISLLETFLISQKYVLDPTNHIHIRVISPSPANIKDERYKSKDKEATTPPEFGSLHVYLVLYAIIVLGTTPLSIIKY